MYLQVAGYLLNFDLPLRPLSRSGFGSRNYEYAVFESRRDGRLIDTFAEFKPALEGFYRVLLQEEIGVFFAGRHRTADVDHTIGKVKFYVFFREAHAENTGDEGITCLLDVDGNVVARPAGAILGATTVTPATTPMRRASWSLLTTSVGVFAMMHIN